MGVHTSGAGGECGACGRGMFVDRPTCLYCGWEAGGDECQRAVAFRPRTYSQGALLLRFVFSSLVLLPVGHELIGGGRELGEVGLLVLGGMALVLGPCALVLQLVRRLRGPIETTPEGVAIEGGERVLRWSELKAVEHRVGWLTQSSFAVRLGNIANTLPSLFSRSTHHRHIGALILLNVCMGLLLLPLLAAHYFLLPAFILLSPWHDRIILVCAGGERFEYHDLEGSLDFVNAVNNQLDRTHGFAAQPLAQTA